MVLAATVCDAEPWSLDTNKLITSARSQIGVTLTYDPAYRTLVYPGGDVPKEIGVCSDVLIRALRDQDIDLQKEVHEDMRANFAQYPKKWGLAKPDRNIDHRRVLNLMRFFSRKDFEIAISPDPLDYEPGDIVAWDLAADLPHIGIISDRKTAEGMPLVVHNIGRGVEESDILRAYPIIGHYRLKIPAGAKSRPTDARGQAKKTNAPGVSSRLSKPDASAVPPAKE